MRMAVGLAVAVGMAAGGQAAAAVKTRKVEYSFGGVKLVGHLAYDDAATGKRPGVLVVHEWWGLNDYARRRAEMLAGMGYVALAVDMYGEGKVAEHPSEAAGMMGEVRKNLAVWEGRAKAGLDALKAQPEVDGTRLAALGYCFGGSTALQLALMGSDIKVAASFHGAMPAATAEQAKRVKARILVCHGAEDKFIPDAALDAFRKALAAAKADYQFVYYANAVHGFTVPGAEKRGVPGLAYDAAADRRSWAALADLLKEAFAD